MASEESHLNNQEPDNNPSSDDQPISTSPSGTQPARETAPAVAVKGDDDDEPRPFGDVAGDPAGRRGRARHRCRH